MERWKIIVAFFFAIASTWVFAQAQFPSASNPSVSVGTAVQQSVDTNGRAVPSSAANPSPQRAGSYGTITAPQYCQITAALSSAINLTTANCSTGTILPLATIAQICASMQGIRYTSSGVVTPTASIGIPVPAGACFQYSGPLGTLKIIQQTSGAVVDLETFP